MCDASASGWDLNRNHGGRCLLIHGSGCQGRTEIKRGKQLTTSERGFAHHKCNTTFIANTRRGEKNTQEEDGRIK